MTIQVCHYILGKNTESTGRQAGGPVGEVAASPASHLPGPALQPGRPSVEPAQSQGSEFCRHRRQAENTRSALPSGLAGEITRYPGRLA